MKVRRLIPLLLVMGIAVLGLLSLHEKSAEARGGLFCQNVPVDQQAERIIFTVNGDETISAYVQINYTGEAPDFSWVVPVPSVPELDVAEIATFDELSNLTQPQFIAPPIPECADFVVMSASADDMGGANVDVLAAGSVGPYNYAVVDLPDPDALIMWLRENGYQVTEEMEPLIHVYNEESMVFLAMKLQPDQGTQDIQPIVMTYELELPMIPLRLTAVAANPNMNVVTWIFAEAQAYPANYAHPTIDHSDIRFNTFQPNTNYLTLVDQTIDLYEGRAFITEYAAPTDELANIASNPLLQELLSDHGYITRFFGRISPEEMTVDPYFNFDSSMSDVSNIHDFSEVDGEDLFFGCENAEAPISIEYDPSVVPDEWE